MSPDYQFSVFTQEEQTVPTRSVKQAYEHAATVIRGLRDLPAGSSNPVFRPGTYSSSDTEVTLTLSQFSQKVNSIIQANW